MLQIKVKIKIGPIQNFLLKARIDFPVLDDFSLFSGIDFYKSLDNFAVLVVKRNKNYIDITVDLSLLLRN